MDAPQNWSTRMRDLGGQSSRTSPDGRKSKVRIPYWTKTVKAAGTNHYFQHDSSEPGRDRRIYQVTW
ncbi:hypothetical protein PG984_005417 [Apiospora sp. TS-2023a]